MCGDLVPPLPEQVGVRGFGSPGLYLSRWVLVSPLPEQVDVRGFGSPFT